MWIEMKKTYIGPLGQFPKGKKQEVLNQTAKQLIKNGYAVKCLPNYDEKTDFVMRQFNALRQDCLQIRSDINDVNSRLFEARKAAGFISNYEKKIELLTTRLDKADKAMADFAKKNNIPLPKENEDEKSEEKSDAATAGAPAAEDAGNTAGQAAPSGQESKLSQ